MAQDKYGYIPPSVQRAMDQHLQRMPANLQRYQSGNTYIPAKAAKSMSNYMQKSMPAHMKQYIEPYMHQKTTAGLNSLDPVTSRPMKERAPVPNLMRRDNSAFGEQFTVKLSPNNQSEAHKSLSFAPQYSSSQSNTPPAPPPAPLPNGNSNPYDFIMNSGGQPKRGLNVGGGGSLLQRLVIVLVGALLLIAIVIVLFSVVFKSSGGSSAQLTDLAQQQTEIARVADIGVNKATSPTTKNLALTTKLSMLSSQQQTIALLAKNGHKINTKNLGIKQNSTIDQQLNSAADNDTFDATFTKLLTDELASYRTSLQTDYKLAADENEQLLIKDSFDGTTLLIAQNPST